MILFLYDSLSLGSAFFLCVAEGISTEKLDDLYQGRSFDNDQVLDALVKFENNVIWTKVDNIEEKIADLLVDYKIGGHFKGREEFGARALGNRSIVCRPDDLKIIHKLNKSIKMRDFWMPFASSILEEDLDRYMLNSDLINSSYMIMAYNSSKEAYKDIIAGLHPFDLTCRPQAVSRSRNPDYHKMITNFKEKTGIGGVLNTSFNLHGSPIVGNPETAIQTLLDSELDFLAIEDYIVTVRNR